MIPALCSSATSSAKDAASPTVSMAAPPYFTTSTLPGCSRMNGSASSSVRAFATVRSRICGGRSKGGHLPCVLGGLGVGHHVVYSPLIRT